MSLKQVGKIRFPQKHVTDESLSVDGVSFPEFHLIAGDGATEPVLGGPASMCLQAGRTVTGGANAGPRLPAPLSSAADLECVSLNDCTDCEHDHGCISLWVARQLLADTGCNDRAKPQATLQHKGNKRVTSRPSALWQIGGFNFGFNFYNLRCGECPRVGTC